MPGQLTPINAYVALSRSRGYHNIHLLRNLEERLFMQHPSEYLRREDERLEDMDRRTIAWGRGGIPGNTYRRTAQLAIVALLIERQYQASTLVKRG